MELSETERQELVALAHEFAESEIRPVAADYDETEEYPREVFEKAAAVGLTSSDLPEEYGGGGIDLLTYCMVVEELAWGDSPIANVLTMAGFAGGSIVAMGTPEQKANWIPRLCGPKPASLGALAITEPGCGSDATAIATYAAKVDGGYVLNGSKTWISNAPDADMYTTFATVAPGTRAKGITCFIVQKGDEGFTVGRKLPKMGSRCFPAAELFFEDCFLPEDRRIGDEGQGFYGLMNWFQWTRTGQAATSIGVGRAALEYAIEYAKEREAFGKKIHEFQGVSFRLTDAKLKLDQARLMCHHAARLADSGREYSVESSMAKLAGAEAAWAATYAAMQTLGSYGHSREFPVEKWLRDAKLEEIYEGTSDIHRLVIARGLLRS